jgi:hypothetical protein
MVHVQISEMDVKPAPATSGLSSVIMFGGNHCWYAQESIGMKPFMSLL